MTGLRREHMREGLDVGVREPGTGQLLRGVIHSLTPHEVRVWIPTSRVGGVRLRPEERGFLTALPYPVAEAGAMWLEQSIPDRPTGRDLIEYWGWAKRTGLVNRPSAVSYLQGARHVLADLPDGYDTDLRALDIQDVITRYTDAHRGELAPASIAQYTSGFRRAIARYLAAAGPGAAPHPGGTR